mmetsp:Transcript_16942/g.35564  ORF Transcript_16942/g.35564 Transcript_16942/m.35564 type:complete len:491 (-) Transcript_16942:1841-3313(-)
MVHTKRKHTIQAMKTHQSSRSRIILTSTGSSVLRCSIGVLILLFIITSGIKHVEGRTSLNPLAIGVRSAIARAPVLTSHPQSSKFKIHQKADLNRFDAPLKYDDDEGDEIENLPSVASSVARGGGAAVAPTDRRLHFWEAMVCGAISRSAAQTIMHPANTMKTILQSSRSIPGKAPLTVKSFARWENAKMLTRGAGAQLLLSIPHGAVNFAVLEFVRRQMNNVVSRSRYAERINRSFGPGMDFLSSALSTVCCSVVSTPQMMICDNIMAGTYPNLVAATSCLMKDRGISGFYTGWWPGIAGKIPSYGLTWTLFEQIKLARTKMFKRPAKDIENSIMGCLASATTVCIMIPMDTVKTRLVTQMNYPDLVPYKGINDCFRRVLEEEGIGAFYRGLTPRLLSVVPMIGIQFGVYEFMKKFMLARDAKTSLLPARGRVSKAEMKRREYEAAIEKSRKERLLQEMALEVAADDDQPFPAPYFKHKGWWAEKISGK